MSYLVPVSDRDELNSLGDRVAESVRLRLRALRLVDGHGGGKKACECVAAALRKPGLGARNLERLWYAYQQSPDWRTLLPHHLLRRDDGVPREFANWWLGQLGANKRSLNKKAVYRAFLRRWAGGESLPGVGTWREWHRRHRCPGTPATMPWSEISPQPPQLSYRNLARLKLPKAAKALTQIGLQAARLILPGIDQDFSGYRFLEGVVFDDARTDFMVFDETTGQIVELWFVAALDVATRKVLDFILIPATEREDGTKRGISRRAVLTLIARILRRYGVPQAWQGHWTFENAAAAVQDETEEVLGIISNGQIKVHRTQVFHGTALLSGFRDEGRGNPRGKIIESMFNLTWNDLGQVQGAMGSSYQLKPASLAPRLHLARGLVSAGHGLPLALRQELLADVLHSTTEGLDLLATVWEAHGERKDHALKGFDFVLEWRWKGQGDDGWRNKETVPLPLHLGKAMNEAIESRRRLESPNERAAKLLALHPGDYAPLAESDVTLLLSDRANVTYDGRLSICLTRDKRRLWFDISEFESRMVAGERYVLVHDADCLDAVWVVSANGNRFLGKAPRRQSIDPRDTEALSAAMRERESMVASLVRTVQSREDIGSVGQRMAGLERKAQLLRETQPAPAETLTDSKEQHQNAKRGAARDALRRQLSRQREALAGRAED